MLYRKLQMIFASAIAAFFIVNSPITASCQTLSTSETKVIEGIVREYILNNPEVIVEAIELFQANQKTLSNQASLRALKHQHKQIYEDPETPTSGDPNASVTIVEFFDYRCPYCRSMSALLVDLIDAEEDVRIIWKELPILGEESVFISQAALAAGIQGKYFDFHRTIMITRSGLSQDWVMTLAEGIGLNMEKLKKDMKSDAVNRQIEANQKLAKKLGIQGIPAFIIDGKIFPGALKPDKLKRLIEEARNS